MSDPTGLAVLFPDLAPATKSVRAERDPAHAQGLAPHVTVLYPFLPEAEVTDAIHARLAALFAAHPGFDVTFPRIARFPDTLYLAPEPAAPFQHLTKAMVRAFPDHPPYGGVYGDPVPHLTLASGPDLPKPTLPLPLTARAEAVTHLAFRADRWYQIARYELAPSGDPA